MGFFDFLKKLVSEASEKKQEDLTIEKEKISLNINEIDKFILKEEKKLSEVAKISIENFYSTLFSLKNEIKNASEDLRNFDFKKRKDPEKVKFIVNKNKESYLALLAIFLLELEKISKDENIEKNLDKIKKSFNNFTKQSARNYYIVNEIVGRELLLIKDKLKEIDILLNDFYKNNNSLLERLHKIEEIKSEIKKIDERKSFVNDSLKEKIEIGNKKAVLENKRLELKNEIERIKDTTEFKSYLELKEKINSKDKEISELQKEISEKINFRILEKYAHGSPEMEKFINKLKENIFGMFLKENEDKFLKIIKESEDLVSVGKISVKSDQKEKIISILSEINKENINYWKNEYEQLLKELEYLKSEKKEIDIEKKEKDLDDIEERIRGYDQELEIEEYKIKKIAEKLNSEINDIQSELGKTLNKEITIEN